jgi:hypothetical protein
VCSVFFVSFFVFCVFREVLVASRALISIRLGIDNSNSFYSFHLKKAKSQDDGLATHNTAVDGAESSCHTVSYHKTFFLAPAP